MKISWQHYKKEGAIAAGLLLFIILVFINPLALGLKAKLVLGIASMMITWWVLDAMPLPVVALVPIVLFPLMGVSSIKEVTKSYADPNIFLFMGGFFLAIAIEKWNLHKRIALGIINKTGTNGNRIILGFIIATSFLSMWLSNTATTMMMFPIAMSVIHVVGGNNEQGNMRHFSLVLMLSIAYASNFALGTIIGTPPNVAYAAYITDKFGYSIGFFNWMIVFTPLTIVLLFMLYWVMVRWLYPNGIKQSKEGSAFIKTEITKLGKLSVPEKRVAFVFSLTVLGWIIKDLVNEWQSLVVLDDTMIAMAGALLLFIIPSGKDKINRTERILDWNDTTRMAWGILLLFGGGIALAKALEDAKLMDQLGGFIAARASTNVFVMILLVTTISVFLSEVMSNVAQVIVMAPVITAVATHLQLDPLLLGIPMTLGASCASMLPMGTPPNAIVFASGYIKIKDMVKTGFVLNIICIIFISIFCWLFQPMLMSVK